VCSEDCGPGEHCDLTSTCFDSPEFSNDTTGFVTNLCCEYTCGPNPNKYACIPNAVPGETQCNPSLDGCSFNDASFVDSCDDCPGQ
jgi:hypothetical protein